MLLGNTPVLIDHTGRTCAARDLGTQREVYDPVADRYDEITDVLIRDVTLGAHNQHKSLPFLLPVVPSDPAGHEAVAVSPRQTLILPGVRDPVGLYGLRTVLPAQIGLPCLDLIGTTVTYVAVFFARRRPVRCGSYLLTCFVLADIAGSTFAPACGRVVQG